MEVNDLPANSKPHILDCQIKIEAPQVIPPEEEIGQNRPGGIISSHAKREEIDNMASQRRML